MVKAIKLVDWFGQGLEMRHLCRRYREQARFHKDHATPVGASLLAMRE
jgi:hypothetical protein